MESRYINLGRNELYTGKKNLLVAQMSVLQIIKKMRNYKVLREKEIESKSKLKNVMASMRIKVSQLRSTFPSDGYIPKIKKKKITEVGKSREKGIEGELLEIQRRLKEMG